MATGYGWQKALLVIVTAFSGTWSVAQEGPQLVEEDSYVGCLTPSAAERGRPQYPTQPLFEKTGGEVRVALTFVAKDAAPRVRLLNPNQWNEEAWDAFLRSIERFVSKYRLPCLHDESAEILQTFKFSPDAKSVSVVDAKDTPSASAKSGCKLVYEGDKPAYPSGSQHPYGNVVLRMKFNQRDEPPAVTVIYGGGHYLLAETAKSWALGNRLRCNSPLEKPVEATETHRFTPALGLPMVLKDMDFITFVKSVDRNTLGKPKFDFNSMACPFTVKVTLLQPHGPNRVAEVAVRDKNRQEFLGWLKTLVFNYPRDYERFLVGQSMQVTVPCMVLDLT